MIKAIVIDPKTKTVKEITKDWTTDDIKEYIGSQFPRECSMVYDLALYVDDDGLWKNPEFYFSIKGITNDQFIGQAVLLGHKDNTLVDCPYTCQEILARTTFYNFDEIMSMRPKKTQEELDQEIIAEFNKAFPEVVTTIEDLYPPVDPNL